MSLLVSVRTVLAMHRECLFDCLIPAFLSIVIKWHASKGKILLGSTKSEHRHLMQRYTQSPMYKGACVFPWTIYVPSSHIHVSFQTGGVVLWLGLTMFLLEERRPLTLILKPVENAWSSLASILLGNLERIVPPVNCFLKSRI